MKFHVIKTDGLVEVGDCGANGLGREEERRIVDGNLERVKVLHAGRVVSMIVNERGAVQDPPLPINARATAVYWNATREGRTCVDYEPLSAPLIHGNAVLYEGLLP